MLTNGLKRETIDEHIKFSGGQLVESRSKTALSIHAVSKIMRAMKPNLLQNGRGKQVLGALNQLEDDGKIGSLRVAPHRRLRTAEPFSARIHFQGDPKAASDSKAAANFSDLSFAVDVFLELRMQLRKINYVFRS